MRLIAGRFERGPVVSSTIAAGAIAVLALTVVAGDRVKVVAPAVGLTLLLGLAYRSLLRWQTLISLLILVILFIPIRRYTVPFHLPFQLEPYRLVVAFIALCWLSSLLIDPRVRLRRSGLEGPILVFVFAALGSVIVNGARVRPVSSDVVKELTFFASFLIVFFLIVSLARQIDLFVKLLVGGGAVVALLGLIEARTNYNLFDHLSSFMPFLRRDPTPYSLLRPRGARLRVLASAQHPIALGAALVMLIPLAVYLARSSGRRRWWLAGALLILGSVSTVSRTAMVMLLVVGVVFLWLRPAQTKRLWPLLLPVLVVAHVALPGTLGSLKGAFLPQGGLIAQQRQGAGTAGSGRIADLAPSLAQFSHKPLLGDGFGTRIVQGPSTNAEILDDQWLTTLLETGAIGAFGLGWLFVRSVRRFAREAKEDLSDRGWLLTAISASLTAFGVGMLTYDAFSFVQVTFLFFILLGLGVVVHQHGRGSSPTRAPL